MKYEFGFLGCGNMGGALAHAVLQSVNGDKVALCERHPEKIAHLCDAFGGKAVPLDEVTDSRFLMLGIKPQVFFSVLDSIAGNLSEDTVLVSMAAGISLAQIEEHVGKRPIIRIMPNTPVSVGTGLVLYVGNELVSEGCLESFKKGLSKSGNLYPINEKFMDAASCVSGCGPAFVYMFIEALADGGVACGLPRKDALLFAAETVSGAAQTVLKTGKHPEQLKDEVCSPGGTTIEGVHALEQGMFRASSMNAVIEAFRKTNAMKK